MRVRAFRNLNVGCISLQAMNGPFKGKVIAHVHNAHLLRCKMVVHEKSRQEVIRIQQKNVHAWIEGDLVAADLIRLRYEVQGFPERDSGLKQPLLKQTKASKNSSAVKSAPTPPPLCDDLHPVFAKLQSRHVRYNPYLRGEFFTAEDDLPVWSCSSAVVKSDGVWAYAVSADSNASWDRVIDVCPSETQRPLSQATKPTGKPVDNQREQVETAQTELALA